MTFHDMCNHSYYDWKRSCDSVALAGAESMHPLFWYRQVIHGSCVHRKHVEQNGSRRVMAESFETGKLHWRDTLGDDSIKINQILTRTLLVSTSKIIPLHFTHWFDSTIYSSFFNHMNYVSVWNVLCIIGPLFMDDGNPGTALTMKSNALKQFLRGQQRLKADHVELLHVAMPTASEARGWEKISRADGSDDLERGSRLYKRYVVFKR